MKTETLDKLLNQVDVQIIRTLLYYDIFNYPLTVDEIYKFLGIKHQDESIISLRLNSLCDRNIVYNYKDLFGLKNSRENVNRRLKGNTAAEKFLLLAKKKAKLISKFP